MNREMIQNALLLISVDKCKPMCSSSYDFLVYSYPIVLNITHICMMLVIIG